MKEERKDMLVWNDEPHACYPDIQPEDVGIDSNQLCRACSNGMGNDICSYHAEKGRRMITRQQKIYAKKG